MDLLNQIQQQLQAPKGQRNTFGNYDFRSCEDILRAVKPLLNGASLLLDDELTLIGDRYYIKATAILKNGKESVSVHAYAREADQKKGMDVAQVTGAASSYARKYALSGLFAIDNEKDADTMDNRGNGKSKETPPQEKKQGDVAKGVKMVGQLLTDRYANSNEFKDLDCYALFLAWIEEKYKHMRLEDCTYEELVEIYAVLNKQDNEFKMLLNTALENSSS